MTNYEYYLGNPGAARAGREELRGVRQDVQARATEAAQVPRVYRRDTKRWEEIKRWR